MTGQLKTNRIITCLLALLVACTMLAACDDEESLSELVASGMSMQAERGTGTLDIVRATPGGSKPRGVEDDSWTVFVYLCGSDLETEDGAATKDLAEMVGATGSDQVRFVVETGGAKKWENSDIKSRRLGRFLVQDGSIMEMDSVSAQDMGDPATLEDFLTWGVENYPAGHMGVILWDHGGGSVAGVCFDERNDYSSLSLRDLDEAFAGTFATMWDKFEFVGFDACLMSTFETANVMATYARCMIASQESEPGSGWEYSSLVEYLAAHPSADGLAFGRVVCDSYLASLDKSSRGFATLSLVDLSLVDQLVQDFYRFSQEMYSAGEDQGTLGALSRSIRKADNYGGNNWLEGYTNMVDLGGLVSACADVTPSADEVLATLHDAVPYQIRGTYHAAASGLSLYYPLKVEDSEELVMFQSIAPNPSYLSYIDRLVHGATGGSESYDDYSDETWFEGGFWNWLLSNTGTPEAEQALEEATDYWEYVDDHSSLSEMITFADEPQVDDDGIYWFSLDEQGLDNAAGVSGLVYELSEDGEDLIALGETYDVYGDWDTGTFYDGFDGMWLSLPDGQNLCLYVADANEDQVVYTSPITLNGEDAYLRMRQDYDNDQVIVEGVWDGIGGSGAADRGVTPLAKGDVIVPCYDSYDARSSEPSYTYEGEPYKVGKRGLQVSYGLLPEGSYQYQFKIEDVFGDSVTTDFVSLEVDEGGNTYLGS